MHGNNVGTLNVYLIQNNIKTVKWRLKGQQNGVWNLGRLPAPRTLQWNHTTIKFLRRKIQSGTFFVCRNCVNIKVYK
jgi:hypothetical protein